MAMTLRDCAPPPPVAHGGLPLDVRDLGRIGYAEAVVLQEGLVEERFAGRVPDTLLLLEHPPVITLGRRASTSDVYATPDQLERQGIELVRASRGGLVTYHGPGQLVGYPIVHLDKLGRTLPDYVCGLQRTVIASLAAVGVAAYSDPEHVGVWTAGGKIGAIGIARRHGVVFHGFAINVQPDLAHFQLINPCGLGDRGVTSIAEILRGAIDMAVFQHRVATTFAAEFGYAGTARR